MGTKKGEARVGKPKGSRLAYDALPKRRHATAAKRRGGNAWTRAVSKARTELGIKGFQPVKKGGALYNRAKQIYGK